jgi:hypothetical protein
MITHSQRYFELRNHLVAVLDKIQTRINRNRNTDDTHKRIRVLEDLLNGGLFVTVESASFSLEVYFDDGRWVTALPQVKVVFSNSLDEDEAAAAPLIRFPIMSVNLDNFDTYCHLYDALTARSTMGVAMAMLKFAQAPDTAH